MDNFILVQVLESDDHVGQEELGLLLRKSPALADVVSQVTPVDVLHQQIQVLPVLKGSDHVDDEGVLELGQQRALVHDRVDGLLLDDFGLVHLLHSQDFVCFFILDLPDFAEASFSNGVHYVEIALVQFLSGIFIRVYCLLSLFVVAVLVFRHDFEIIDLGRLLLT